jgi:hypothetical protein
MYSSLTTGVSDPKTAQASTKIMTDYLSQQINVPIDFRLVEGKGPGDLIRFGEQISSGNVHLGVVWGVEYGWLKSAFNDLEPMVSASTAAGEGKRLGWPLRIMVRSGFQGATKPERLKSNLRALAEPNIHLLEGKVLAVAENGPMMNDVYLKQLLMRERHKEPSNFFRAVLKKPTLKEAIEALVGDNPAADCVVVDVATFTRFAQIYPFANTKLEVLLQSEPFPNPVLVGSKDQVKRLKLSLWDDLANELKQVQSSPYASECCKFWKIDGFFEPDGRFCVNTAKVYPLTALPK